MILQKEISTKAIVHNVPKSTIDKDWVLGHLINGLYKEVLFAENLIFKGGTCLRKCYYENYRFSEDLDFTLMDPLILVSEEWIRDILNSVEKSSGIRFYLQEFSKMIAKDEFVGYKIITKYWGADHPKNQPIPSQERWHTYIKMEIITHELICIETENRALIHPYSDADLLQIKVPCYSINEVICEKLRAMLQRKYTAPRDYYDMWYILNNSDEINWSLINQHLHSKLNFKNVFAASIEDFFTEKHIRTLHSHWQSSIGHHLAHSKLPSVVEVVENLKILLIKNLKV